MHGVVSTPATVIGVDQVQLDRDVATWLTDFALSLLYQADTNDEGCCPKCCGPCAGLQRMAETGQLDDLMRETGARDITWDAAENRVDRQWLHRAWRMTSCHDGGGCPERPSSARPE